MAEIAIQDAEARRFLSKLVKRQKDVKGGDKAYLGAISAIVFSDIISHFENQSGPDGSWKAWSKVYSDHMQKTGKGGNKLLQDSGRLRQSFTPSSYRTVSDGILWFNPARTAAGFPYAAAHDEGGDRLPQRQFMWLSDEGMERIESMTLKFLEEE